MAAASAGAGKAMMKPSNETDVSVVICTYTEDRWDDLLAAVDSVRRQSKPALETIVVVDHNPTMLERVRSEIVDEIADENRQ